MIESTFILLNGIGEATERRLWRQGIGTWKSFLDCRSVSGINSARKALYDEEVSTALAHWQAGEARYFARVEAKQRIAGNQQSVGSLLCDSLHCGIDLAHGRYLSG